MLRFTEVDKLLRWRVPEVRPSVRYSAHRKGRCTGGIGTAPAPALRHFAATNIVCVDTYVSRWDCTGYADCVDSLGGDLTTCVGRRLPVSVGLPRGPCVGGDVERVAGPEVVDG